MDEKTDVLPSDQLPATDVDASAGIGNDTDFLPTASSGTDTFISTASTDTAISTDALADILTSTETAQVSEKTSSSEEFATEALPPADALISSDAVSIADDLTSMDGLQTAEELSSENTKACEEAASANKVFSPDVNKPSQADCELEEELKRLHEGDPIDQVQPPESLLNASTNGKTTQEKITSDLSQENSIMDTSSADEPSPQKEILDPVEMLTAADDASKDPVLIKNAQEDIKKIDVLVCGTCHEVFHFVEEFQAHKSGPCTGVSNVLTVCEGESKPQVWGFTLWKNKQQKSGEKIVSSWVIYQKWCKLPQIDKDAWITAGHKLQFCTKLGYAKVTENKQQSGVPQLKQIEKDPLALDGFGDSNKENSVVVGNRAAANKQNASEVIKKTIVKPVRLNNDVTILPSTKNGEPNSNKAIRTIRSTEKREYVVERIVAKRFNPKRKTWEYQIKWENFPSEENTWEPIANLNHCKQMVEEFEQQLKKLKAEKAKQQAATMSPKVRGKSIKIPQMVSTPSSSFSGDLTPGRPQRTSKQKALNQVKAWCGNISDADEGGVKRSFEDEDSDDSFEKKMKYEEFSDDSDADVKPKITQYKKIAPKPPTMHIIKNGVGKTTPLPQNVLIPDANGVVRINQKQLPSLSTGVYIMSKTAGIIKLDSTTSKVATSGGQTIVKVAPKIGQTQIKIVKKDGTTTTTKQVIQMTPTKQTQGTKIYKPVITKVKKAPEVIQNQHPKPTPTKITVRPREEPKKEALVADDSDDGIEELPFPEDLPLPQPESPPTDFTLDPFTGKIAGQEYPEPAEEPEPEPEPGIMKCEVEDTTLENIVKLAAADITEDDLKSGSADTPMETEPIPAERDEDTRITHKTEPVASVTSSPSTSGTSLKVTTTPTLVRRGPSLLNKALSSSAILRKSLLNTPSPSKVPHRILNQTPASRIHNVSSVVRTVPRSSNVVRTKPLAPRPKFNISGQSSMIRSQHENSPRNVYSKSPLSTTRKIGNTTIRSAAAFTGHRPQARIVQTATNVHKVSPKKESLLIRHVPEKVATPPKPKTVISMPSLIGDDEPSLSPPATEAAKSPTLPATASSPTTKQDTPPATATPPASTAASEPSVETPTATPAAPAADPTIADISSFTLADNENPIFITGDDGTVYQVAGQNEQGQTILLTQGSDGQQQCLLVTNEVAEAMETSTEEPQADVSMPEVSTDVTEPLSVKTDDASDQVVAQVVRAEPPSPGGTHKVVVMLPDGNLMVTQVSPEEYASLELE